MSYSRVHTSGLCFEWHVIDKYKSVLILSINLKLRVLTTRLPDTPSDINKYSILSGMCTISNIDLKLISLCSKVIRCVVCYYQFANCVPCETYQRIGKLQFNNTYITI